MADGDTGLEKLVLTRLLRLNATLQGVVTGTVVGLGVFIATNWLLLKGGEVVGPHLSLLGQFFIGYRVKSFGKLYRICVWLRTRFCRRILRRQNIQLDCSRQRRKTLRPSTTQTALKIIESPSSQTSRFKDRWRDRFQFCFYYRYQCVQAVLTPTTKEQQVLPLPMSLDFLYYFFDPFRLTVKYGLLGLAPL